MLTFYVEYRPQHDILCKTVFPGILKFPDSDGINNVEAIKNFYIRKNFDHQRMVTLTSDGVQVMLGTQNGVAAILGTG